MALFILQPVVWLSLLAAAATGLWLGYQHQLQAQQDSPIVVITRRQWQALLLAFSAVSSAGFLLFRYIFVGPPFLRAQNEILLVMLISATGLAWVAVQRVPRVAAWKPFFLRNRLGLALLVVGLFGIGNVPDA